MSDQPQKFVFVKSRQKDIWKSELEKVSPPEGVIYEWVDREPFANAEEFAQFLDEHKADRIFVEEIPYEWVKEWGWSWNQIARSLQCFDQMVWQGQRWQASLGFVEAMRLSLIEESETFDLSQPVYLVGHGERARISVYVLSLLGFRKIYCISPDEEALREDITCLKKFLFGLEIVVVDPDTLTQQTENGPLVISTFYGKEKVELGHDMAYFNYMSPNGLVLDFEPQADESYFVEEAKRADMRILLPEVVIQNYLKNMTRV